jgi:hypothetical protein
VFAWILLWAALTLIGFHWSEGRLSPRSWIEATAGWISALSAPPPEDAPTPRRGFEPSKAAAPRSPAETAAIVAAPSLTSQPPLELSRHTGTFDSVLELDDAPGTELPPEGIQVTPLGRDDVAVNAGPGCERAKRRFKESFLAEEEDPASLALLGDARRYEHCQADLMSLRLCALVHQGKAIGVTVISEPPSRRVATCAAIVAKTLSYPHSKRPRLLRTEIYFQ